MILFIDTKPACNTKGHLNNAIIEYIINSLRDIPLKISYYNYYHHQTFDNFLSRSVRPKKRDDYKNIYLCLI